MIYVFLHPVRIVEEGLDMAPRALDRVRICPSTHINYTDLMVHGVVSISVSRSRYVAQ